MGFNLDAFLTVPEHSQVNHAGIPGVGVGGGGSGGTEGGGEASAGVILPFGGAVASIPSGYLACDGSVVAQVTYPDLFTAIGTSWDIGGEGGGNFRLPDFRGKSLVGLNNDDLPAETDSGFSTRDLADLGGAETDPHTHTGPNHTHIGPNHTHTISTDGAHTHPIIGASSPSQLLGGSESLGSAGGHNHTGNTGAGGTAFTSSDGGGSTSSTPIDSMSPFAVVTYIIKTEDGTTGLGGGGGGSGGTPRQEIIPLEVGELPISLTGGDVVLTNMLSFTPIDDSVKLYVNRLFHIEGATLDYELTGTDGKSILWLVDSGTAPELDSSDTIVVCYLSSD